MCTQGAGNVMTIKISNTDKIYFFETPRSWRIRWHTYFFPKPSLQSNIFLKIIKVQAKSANVSRNMEALTIVKKSGWIWTKLHTLLESLFPKHGIYTVNGITTSALMYWMQLWINF